MKVVAGWYAMDVGISDKVLCNDTVSVHLFVCLSFPTWAHSSKPTSAGLLLLLLLLYAMWAVPRINISD